MNPMMHHETRTAVQSQEAKLAQRKGCAIQNQFTLSALHLYVQLLAGMSYMLYRQVSTPSWLSLLLLLFPLGAGYFVSCCLARKDRIMETKWGRAAQLFLFLCLFLDAQLSLCALSEMVREILPDFSSPLIALLIILSIIPALEKQHASALPTLSCLLRWPLMLSIAFSMVGALGKGDGGNLFPLLGQGAEGVLLGTGWMVSCLSAALTPLYIPGPAMTLQQKKKGFVSLLLSLGAGILTALLSAYLLPFYFLARPETIGSRLLLIIKSNPSLLAWSLLICAMMLLFLLSITCALSRSRHLLSHVVGKPMSGWMALLLFPLPAFSTDLAEQLILQFAPIRTACMGLALLLLLMAPHTRKEKQKA